MPWPDPVVLTGDHAKLEPLAREHRDALIAAVKDGELWTLWYTFVPSPEKMDAEIERLCHAGGDRPQHVIGQAVEKVGQAAQHDKRDVRPIQLLGGRIHDQSFPA